MTGKNHYENLRQEYISRLNIAFDNLEAEDYSYAAKVLSDLGSELKGVASGAREMARLE